jgi:hypothetical protein
MATSDSRHLPDHPALTSQIMRKTGHINRNLKINNELPLGNNIDSRQRESEINVVTSEILTETHRTNKSKYIERSSQLNQF